MGRGTPLPADQGDVLEGLLGEAGLLLQVPEIHLEPHLLVQGMLQVVRAHLQYLHGSPHRMLGTRKDDTLECGQHAQVGHLEKAAFHILLV